MIAKDQFVACLAFVAISAFFGGYYLGWTRNTHMGDAIDNAACCKRLGEFRRDYIEFQRKYERWRD